MFIAKKSVVCVATEAHRGPTSQLWCKAVVTAALMDCCSWRHHERKRLSRRRRAAPHPSQRMSRAPDMVPARVFREASRKKTTVTLERKHLHKLKWSIKHWANASALDEKWDVKQLCCTVRSGKNMRVRCIRWGVLSSGCSSKICQTSSWSLHWSSRISASSLTFLPLSESVSQFSPGHLVPVLALYFFRLCQKIITSFLALFAVVSRRFRFFDQSCFMESLHLLSTSTRLCVLWFTVLANFDCHASSLILASSQCLLSIFSTESLVMTWLSSAVWSCSFSPFFVATRTTQAIFFTSCFLSPDAIGALRVRMLQKFSGSMSCPSSPLSSKTGLPPNHLPFGPPHCSSSSYIVPITRTITACAFPKRVGERDLLIAFFLRRDEIESSHKCFGQRRHVWQAPPDVREQKWRGAHHSGALAKRRIRSQAPSQQSRQGAQDRRVHVHPCCRLQPGRLGPQPQTQEAPRVQQEDESGSGAFTMVSTEKHAAQAGDPAREW